MKILAISGSPRTKGNTAFLLEQALGEIKKYGIETELVHLSKLSIKDCTGCEGCRDSYSCVIKDDMQQLYPLLEKADAVILGSPTYFYDVTAHMKAFLDRLYCYEVFDENDRSVWMSVNEALGGKLAAVISVCEQKRAEDTGHAAMTMQLTLQSLGYRVVDCTEVINLYTKDEAANNQAALEQAKNLGQRLAKTLQLKQTILENVSSTKA